MLEEAIDDHQRALRRRLRQPRRGALPGRLGEAVGPARPAGADRDRRLRRPVGPEVRAAERPPRRGRAEGRAGGRVATRPGRAASRAIGQMPICWGPDRGRRRSRVAHEQFRWFGGGWKVNAELPGPAGFAGATQFVRREDVADSIPCGPDVDADRRGGEAVEGRRLHRPRVRADRRRHPGGVHALGREGAAAGAARDLGPARTPRSGRPGRARPTRGRPPSRTPAAGGWRRCRGRAARSTRSSTRSRSPASSRAGRTSCDQ